MPVVLTIDGESRQFAEPFDAVVWLLRTQCTAEQIQSLRLDVGRLILNHLEVIEHEHDGNGAGQSRNRGSVAADAQEHRNKRRAAK